MVSVASGGTADRIAARILFKVLRGSGTPARYSSTFVGAPLPFAAELRFPDFTFCMGAMLQGFPHQVHAPERTAAVRMKLVSQDCLPGTKVEVLGGCPTGSYRSCHPVSNRLKW